MKVIISHDIDHLSVREHIFKDLIVPKYIFWCVFELCKRKISIRTFCRKIIGLFRKSSWNNLKDLLEFDRQNGVNPTFFVGVNNGKGLSYSKKQASNAINLIKQYGFDIGVHGICYDNYEGIKKEYEDFRKISGLEKFGIRMHYLRLNENTLGYLAQAGYLFDTTVLSEELSQEYKVDGLTEIPFHIMDSTLLGPRSNLTLEDVKERTKNLLEGAEREHKKYVAILFHPRNFSEEFPHFKSWYIWLINYCKEKKWEFVNYKNLLKNKL